MAKIQNSRTTTKNQAKIMSLIIQNVQSKELYEINPVRQGENQMMCPECSQSRKKKRDKCLNWNADKGVGQCHHCNASFVVYNTANPFGKRSKKEYAIPQWRNITELTDKATMWFTGRMISQETLRAMGVYSDTEWMPQLGSQAEVICFPYLVGGELRNIKYRGPQKSFKMYKDAELVLFNFDCVASAKELIITEGEIDALSFYEVGLKNVVSVPNGAGAKDLTYLDDYIDSMAHIEKFYIAADMDEPGLNLRGELVRRLDPERCKIVSYQGYKDANELLMGKGGLALKEAIKNATDVPLRGVTDLNAYYDDIRAIFENGLPQANGIGIPEIDAIVKWKTGMLAIFTGIPSHGKSEMLDFLSVRLNLLHGWKAAFFSPENMPYHRFHYPKLAAKLAGTYFQKGYINDQDYDQIFDYIEDNFKYIDAGDDYTVETIIATAKSLVSRYGIKILNIDPYNCFEHRQERGETETAYIGRFLDTLSRFAKKYDVLVNLVAHPRKMERQGDTYQIPTLYDINGSANFYNKADIGIVIHRDFNAGRTDLRVQKVRFKDLGQPGIVTLQYNCRNGRYQIPPGDVNMLDCSNYLHQPAVQIESQDHPLGEDFDDVFDAPPF